MNLSPTSEPSSDEEVHTSAVAIKLESHLPFEPTSLVATRVLFEKGEKETPQEKRVTMSKSRKKAFVCGVGTMNHGDHLLQALVGLKPSPGSQRPFVLVFTSHPMLFADASVFRTIDTGHAAQFVLEDQVGPELFDEPREMGLVPLNHARLLSEATSFCVYARIPWVNLDVLDTKRWDNYALAEIPRICSSTIALTTNSEELGDLIEAWCKTPSHVSQSSQDDPERHFDELSSLEFVQQLAEIGEHFHLEAMTHAAFPAEAVQEHEEDTFDAIESQEDLGVQDPAPQLVSEETFLDTVEVPGLPLEEAKRREAWKKLPQRVRIAVRRLRRQFGHCPRNVLISMLQAAKIDKRYIEACKLHRCMACETTAPKKGSHKTSLPYEYKFNHTLGIDILEVQDSMGRRYSILNLICLGTTFQQAVLLKEGKNPTSSQVLRALMNRWVSWGGNPVELACDRGLHNRGVLAKYCGENNIQVRHAPLECPEAIGRVERHGGILKAMYKKVAVEVQPMGPDDVEKILNECCQVKNTSTRVGGFSPTQWIFWFRPTCSRQFDE